MAEARPLSALPAAAPAPGRALLLATTGPGPARALWRLLEQGWRLAGCWVPAHLEAGAWEQDRWIGRRNPAWSLGAALAAAGVAPRPVPALTRWDWRAAFDAAAPDLLLSAHFSYRLPEALLALLPGRALNLHPALLPRYRGPSAREALLADGAGESAAGVTLHLMAADFDTGPLVAQRSVPLRPGDDAVEWELRLARAYGDLVRDALPAYMAGRLAACPQPDGGSYAALPGAAFNLSPATRLERACHLVEIFGQWRYLTYRDGAGAWRVRPPLRQLGPATGEPPRRRPLSLECDLADARVRLAAWIPGHGKRLRRRRRRRLARAEP